MHTGQLHAAAGPQIKSTNLHCGIQPFAYHCLAADRLSILSVEICPVDFVLLSFFSVGLIHR